VAVEVIGLQVEEDADARPKRLDVLELEARELADDPHVGGRHPVERGERTADVSGNLDRPSGDTEDRAE
jgi:hypothetical protein